MAHDQVQITNNEKLPLSWKPSEETRKKMSKASLGRIVNLETREKLSKLHTGRKRSEEAKHNMSLAQIERYKNDQT